ncbi:MAG: BC1881 family protein [Lachnospiraceae bacterium]|nr:BC1881 family protein [Lachnospiraceae bacterium]
MVELAELSNFKTCELVEELKNREGVETQMAEPYEDVKIETNGPAIVLMITD